MDMGRKLYKDVFLLAAVNSKIKGKTKFDVQFIVKGNKVPLGVTQVIDTNLGGAYGDYLASFKNIVKADDTELSYGQIKKIFDGEMYSLATSSIYSSYLNDDNTYFLINDKEVKPSINVLYYGGSENTDNFYKDFNRRLEGIGVEYDA